MRLFGQFHKVHSRKLPGFRCDTFSEIFSEIRPLDSVVVPGHGHYRSTS
jgi:hypothetical protein